MVHWFFRLGLRLNRSKTMTLSKVWRRPPLYTPVILKKPLAATRINGIGLAFHAMGESLVQRLVDRNRRRASRRRSHRGQRSERVAKSKELRKCFALCALLFATVPMRRSGSEPPGLKLRIEAGPQNAFLLCFLQIAHEAIFVFDFIEPQSRKVGWLSGINFGGNKRQFILLPRLDKRGAKFLR